MNTLYLVTVCSRFCTSHNAPTDFNQVYVVAKDAKSAEELALSQFTDQVYDYAVTGVSVVARTVPETHFPKGKPLVAPLVCFFHD